MNDINIDTIKIQAQIESLKLVLKRLEQIYTKVKGSTNIVKDYWNTSTSEKVFVDFEDFYSWYEQMRNALQRDVSFLENTVKGSYTENNDRTNKSIDEKFA